MGRNTQGVRLMEPGDEEKVASIASLADRDEETEAVAALPAPADA